MTWSGRRSGTRCCTTAVEMLQAFFVKAAENTYLYMFSTFVLVLATSFLKLPRQEALTALLWGSAFEVLVVIAAAYVSDRIGRRPVLLVGFVAAAIASYGLFTLDAGGLVWAASNCRAGVPVLPRHHSRRHGGLHGGAVPDQGALHGAVH